MKRSPLKRVAMKRARGKKATKDFLEMQRARPRVYARSQGHCEATKAPYRFDPDLDATCTRYATHVHHRKYKSAGGSNELDNLLHVCQPCHTWIHANKPRARFLGITPDWRD